VDYTTARLLICSVDSTSTPQEPDPIASSDSARQQISSLPQGTFWQRQWLFLRRRWWNVDSLSFTQRIFSFLRGVILIALGVVGLLIVVNNTLNFNSSGLDAVAKLMAEFLLIPVGLLALIIAGYGLSQIVRSFMPNAAVAARHALDRAAWGEEQSEEFQLRDENEP
jgi:hypothetical protein